MQLVTQIFFGFDFFFKAVGKGNLFYILCEIHGKNKMLALITQLIKHRQSTHSCVSIFKIEKCQFSVYWGSHPSRQLGAEASLLGNQAST